MIQKKIAMIGMYGVGKTSLVKRFIENSFDEKYHSTLGVKVDHKDLDIQDQTMRLVLWDIAGAEDYFTIPQYYIKGTQGYLLVIDGTRLVSFDKGVELIEHVEKTLPEPVPFIAVINKADLVDQWELKDEHIEKLATYGCEVIRSSALTGEGVDQAFKTLANQLA